MTNKRMPTAGAVLLILLGVLLLGGGSCFGLAGVANAMNNSGGLALVGIGLALLAAGIAAIIFAARRM